MQSDSGEVHLASLSTGIRVLIFVYPPWVFVVTLDAFKDLIVRGRSRQHAAEGLKPDALRHCLISRTSVK